MPDPLACAACGADMGNTPSRRIFTTARGGTAEYAGCPHCGLLRLDPLPGSAELAELYDADYYGQGETKFGRGIEWFRSACMRRRARRVHAMLARSPGQILDVGCGDGRFLDGMRRLGCRIVGAELEGPACDRASRVPGIRLCRQNFTQAALSAGSFDAVTLWHVLEHMADPFAALRCCRELLRADGLLVVEVPNLESLQNRSSGDRGFHLDPPRHLYQFTDASLAALLRRAGFDVFKRETGSMEMGVFGAAQSWLNRFIEPRDLLFDMLRTRNHCRGGRRVKFMSVALGLLFVPCAFLFTGVEAAVGRGPVLRCFCRPR